MGSRSLDIGVHNWRMSLVRIYLVGNPKLIIFRYIEIVPDGTEIKVSDVGAGQRKCSVELCNRVSQVLQPSE